MKMGAIFQLFSDKISERTIEQDLSLSSFVIGNDSSVLVSAAQSGIASFQLNCSLRNRLPGVKPVESHLDVLGNLSYEGSIRTDSNSGHDHLKDVATQILRQLNG